MKKLLLVVFFIFSSLFIACSESVSLTVNEDSKEISLKTGEVKLINVTLKGSGEIVYESTDNNVASCDSGAVKAVNAGECEIIITVKNTKIKETVKVKVIEDINKTIDEIIDLKDGTYETKAIVVAINEQSFVVSSGRSSMLVFKGNSWTKDVNIGDKLILKGTVKTVNSGKMFDTDTTYVKDGTDTINESATTVDAKQLDELLNSEKIVSTKTKLQGTLKVDGENIYLEVKDTSAVINIAYMASDEILKALDGKNVELEGYIVYKTDNKYLNIVLTTYQEIIPEVEVMFLDGLSEMVIGDEQTLSVDFSPKGSTAFLTWESSDTEIAIVSCMGIISAIKEGTVSIKATAENGVFAEFEITVTKAVVNAEGIILIINGTEYQENDTIELTEFDVVEIGYKYLPLDKEVVEGHNLSLVNTEKAHFNTENKLVADAPGQTTLIAYVDSAESEFLFNINIREKHFDPETVEFTSTSKQVEIGSSISFKAKVMPERADQSITWSVSDTNIATIDSNGTLTALNAGKVKVIATSKAITTIKAEYEVEVITKMIVDKSKIYVNRVLSALYSEVTYEGNVFIVGKTAFTSVTEAINEVDDNGTIYVAAGEYKIPKDIKITKAIKIYGPNKDKAYGEARSEEANIISGPGLIDVASLGFELNGVKVTSTTTKFIRLLEGAGNFTFKSNYVFGLNSVIRQDSNNLPLSGYIHLYDNTFESCLQFGLWIREGAGKDITEVRIENNKIVNGGTIGGYEAYKSAFFRISEKNNDAMVVTFINNYIENFGEASSDPQPVLGLFNHKTTIRYNTFKNTKYHLNPYAELTNLDFSFNLFLDGNGNVIDPTKDPIIDGKYTIKDLCSTEEDRKNKYLEYIK